jgi:glutaredoxin 3
LFKVATLYILDKDEKAKTNQQGEQMSKTVTIYTTNTCAYCVMVKKWLTSKGQTYQEVNLDEKPELRQEVIELSGQMAVPVTVVSDAQGENKDITVGWNPGKLAAALSA